MKPKQALYVSVFLTSLLMTSCNPGIYVPAAQNVPLFQKKGEVNLQLGQTNLQGAIAVSNNIGLTMNIQHVSISSQKFMSKFMPDDQSRIEVAGGYFSQKKTTRSPIYECYVGGGYGIISYIIGDVWIQQPTLDYKPYDITLASRNWNVFVQPAIGWKSRKSSIALSTKINYLSYIHSAIRLTEPTKYDSRYLELEYPSSLQPAAYDESKWIGKANTLSSSNYLFIEPSLTATTGGNRFQVTVQLFYWLLVNPSQYKLIGDGQTFGRFGLALRLPGSNSKKKAH